MKCDSRSSSFPDPTATTTRITRRRKCSARKRSSSGTRRRIFAAPMRSSSPAGSRTAITCAPERSRGFRRSWMPFGHSRPMAVPFSASAMAFRFCSKPGLLPGAMLRNRGLKFRCEHVHVRVEQTDTPVHAGVPATAGAAHSRSRTAKATTSRHRTSCASWSRIGRSCSAMSTQPAR